MFKCSQFLFKLLMVYGLPRHHPGAHGRSQAVFCGSLGISLPYFGMIGQTQVIVETPYKHFPSLEFHLIRYIAFQLGKEIIPITYVGKLSQRPHVIHYLIEYVHVDTILINEALSKLKVRN